MLMGCDIHSMVEVKTTRYSGDYGRHENGLLAGKWEPGSERWEALGGRDPDQSEAWFTNSYYDPESKYEPFTRRYRFAPLDNRNYDLFALLANVRNGYGFAGVRRGDAIEPLDMPRGIPSDASYGWLEYCDSWGPDLHSHSWFTLAELVAFQEQGRFGQRMRRTGVISGKYYEELQRTGKKPESWSGSISGNGIITITPDEYDAGTRAQAFTPEEIAQIRAGWERGQHFTGWTEELEARLAEWIDVDRRTHVQYVWEDTLDGSTGELEDAIAQLKRYAEGRPPRYYTEREKDPVEDKPDSWDQGVIPHENIRIVFAFDN